MNILQIGLGNFGRRHLEAWHRLGAGDRLWICELDEAQWVGAHRYRFPGTRLGKRWEDFLDSVQVVDIVTPTQTHFPLIKEALLAGKDVFVEKPMTLTSEQAQEVSELASARGLLVQVGYGYRYHPAAERLKEELQKGTLGRLRVLSGSLCGFKRARNDVGVTHTDGINFLDLLNWLLGSFPSDVYAVTRDHFGRGLEDFSLVLLEYPDGVFAQVESGYIQPGRFKDKVVAGAMTTKEITLVGERAAAELDFEMERLVIHPAHHERIQGTWTARVGDSTDLAVASCDPAEMVARELSAFLRCVEARRPPTPGPLEGGVHLARLMEAIYESAQERRRVHMESSAKVPA